MSKVTVTESQMGSIKRQRDEYGWHLEEVLEIKQNGKFKKESNRSLNEMSIEQIVLAWYGHVNVEPEKVDFFEAMKALKVGKAVMLHQKDCPETTLFRDWYKLESREGLLFSDLFKGNWTIED